MDLNTIASVVRPREGEALPAWQPGDAFLGGGTWLFSEPQPRLKRLIDLDALGWPPLKADAAGLHVAATCRIARLAQFELPGEWRASPLVRQCCEALLGSFKIWNAATVGGNLCLGLPAGPLIALAVALEGVCSVQTPAGLRSVPAEEFVTGPQQTVLSPGDLLRAIDIPARAWRCRTAFRRVSLNPLGRSAALLIGAAEAGSGRFSLTVTAATRRPVKLRFEGLPDEEAMHSALAAAVPRALYFDDVHGHPDWRRHMTYVLAGEILAELGAAE